MKKRNIMTLATLAVCAAATLSIVSCGSKKASSSPQDIYQTAVQKIQEASGVDAKLDMKMKVAAAGMNMDMSVTGDVKNNRKADKDMQMSAKLNTEVLGQSIPMTYYYKDKTFYMDVADQKVACKLDVEKARKRMPSSYMTLLDSEMIKDLRLEKKDADQVLSYSLDPKKAGEYAKKVLSSTDGASMPNMGEIDADIKGFKGQLTVDKDGNPIKQVVQFTMTTKTAGQNMSTKVAITTTYRKLGDTTIDFPAFDSYQKVAESELDDIL